PFKAISEDSENMENLLTGHSDLTKAAIKRARLMSSLGDVTQTKSVYFVDEANRESIQGTAIIENEEIEGIQDPDYLRDLIKERTKA
ncbi:MAG: transcriptional regulator, partial [Halobacteriaceae archaeon]